MKTCNCGNNSFIPVPTMIFFTKDYFSACTIVCAKCGKDYTVKIEFQLENIDSEYSDLN